MDTIADPQLRFLLDQVAQIKYEKGVLDVEYNMCCDIFSFCHSVEKKFDVLIVDACVTPDKTHFAIVYSPGNMQIFQTQELKLMHTISEVSGCQRFNEEESRRESCLGDF